MKEFLIKKSASFIEVLNQIDINTKGIVFVVDDRHRLIGSISDGDIRRLLMNGIESARLISY